MGGTRGYPIEDMIRVGTNRLVIVGQEVVYKLPLGLRGLRANRIELRNAQNNPYVAHTEKRWYGLRQERLHRLVTYDRYVERKDVRKEHQFLYDIKLHNRLQVGCDKNGIWKIFDFEDVKWKDNQCPT